MKTLQIAGLKSKLIAVMICIFSVACQKNGYSPNGNNPAGKSSVNIYLVDDPLFRSFWQSGKLLFSNAVFMVGQ